METIVSHFGTFALVPGKQICVLQEMQIVSTEIFNYNTIYGIFCLILFAQ